jgi:hypothetical protein
MSFGNLLVRSNVAFTTRSAPRTCRQLDKYSFRYNRKIDGQAHYEHAIHFPVLVCLATNRFVSIC